MILLIFLILRTTLLFQQYQYLQKNPNLILRPLPFPLVLLPTCPSRCSICLQAMPPVAKEINPYPSLPNSLKFIFPNDSNMLLERQGDLTEGHSVQQQSHTAPCSIYCNIAYLLYLLWQVLDTWRRKHKTDRSHGNM